MASIRRATEADAATIHALVLELAAAIGMTGKVASRIEESLRIQLTELFEVPRVVVVRQVMQRQDL